MFLPTFLISAFLELFLICKSNEYTFILSKINKLVCYYFQRNKSLPTKVIHFPNEYVLKLLKSVCNTFGKINNFNAHKY